MVYNGHSSCLTQLNVKACKENMVLLTTVCGFVVFSGLDTATGVSSKGLGKTSPSSYQRIGRSNCCLNGSDPCVMNPNYLSYSAKVSFWFWPVWQECYLSKPLPLLKNWRHIFHSLSQGEQSHTTRNSVAHKGRIYKLVHQPGNTASSNSIVASWFSIAYLLRITRSKHTNFISITEKSQQLSHLKNEKARKGNVQITIWKDHHKYSNKLTLKKKYWLVFRRVLCLLSSNTTTFFSPKQQAWLWRAKRLTHGWAPVMPAS